jgi:hypothetical protein
MTDYTYNNRNIPRQRFGETVDIVAAIKPIYNFKSE